MRSIQAILIGLIFTILLSYSLAAHASDPADKYFKLGLEFFHSRQFAEAIDAYTKAIEYRPGFIKAYYNRAVARLNLSYYQQAIYDYTVVLSADPDHIKARNFRGFCHLKNEDYIKACEDFDIVIAKDPSQTDALFNRGIAFMKEGLFTQAIQDFSQTVRYKPNHGSAYFNRGYCFVQTGDYHLALGDYQQQINIDPSFTDVYLNKGNTEVRLELYQEATLSYTRSIAFDPNNSEGYEGRAFAYLGLQQYSKAVTDFSDAIMKDGGKMVNYKNRATAYAKMKQSGLALKDLRIYLSAKSDDTDALVMQGELLNAVENFDDAKSSLDKAIRINPDYMRAYLVRGYTHQRLGNSDRAIVDFSKVLTTEANNENALFNRANLLFEKGEWLKAINDFDELIILNSSYGEAYLMRAKSKINKEAVEDGCLDLKKARSLGITEAKELIIRYCR